MSRGRSLHQISSNTTMIVLLSNYNGTGIVKAVSPRSGNQWLSVAKWNKRDEKDPLSRCILHAFTFTRNFHLRNNPLLRTYFDDQCGRLNLTSSVFLLILSTSLYMIRNAILLGFVYTNELEIIRKKKQTIRGNYREAVGGWLCCFLEASFARRKGTYNVSTKQPGLEGTHRDVG